MEVALASRTDSGAGRCDINGQRVDIVAVEVFATDNSKGRRRARHDDERVVRLGTAVAAPPVMIAPPVVVMLPRIEATAPALSCPTSTCSWSPAIMIEPIGIVTLRLAFRITSLVAENRCKSAVVPKVMLLH